MKKLVVNDYFRKEFLDCGNTYDNYIFHDCPKDFLPFAYDSLSKDDIYVRSCNVRITRQDEDNVEYTLKECSSELQRIILCSDYVNSRVLKEVYKDIKEKGAHFAVLKETIKAFDEGQLWRVKQLHTCSPFMHDIIDAYKKFGAFEINFFLEDTENILIQKAVNNFISSRAPFSVKLFTNLEHLPTYLDEGDNRIEAPHDYLSMNVRDYITYEEMSAEESFNPIN